jgi:hypothetical protein
MRPNHVRKQYCVPLIALRIERDESTLKLYSLSQTGRTKETWACLRFTSYEGGRQSPVQVGFGPAADPARIGLVLFFCTFLAMKAEDTGNRDPQTEDHELRGETSYYSG